MKRILVITRQLTSGGAERIAANVATELNNGETKTWLLVFDGTGATYPCGTDIIDLKSPIQSRILDKAIWYIKIWNNVRKIKKNLNITHTISFLNEPDLINILTAGKGKTIVSVRNRRSMLNKNVITKIKDIFVFNRADLIVSLSNGVKDDLIDYYKINGEKIRVIYNACDIEEITNKAYDYDNTDFSFYYNKEKTVISAGRLTKQKGQWHLIRAFRKVVNRIPEARLMILGQGIEEEYLKALISDLSLENNVIMLGYQSNPYCYLKKADIFAFPSLYEGFGNILLEAMACGLPIISSDCIAGPRELLEPGTSYDDCTKDRMVKAKYGILLPVCDGKKYMAKDKLTKEENILADTIIMLLSEKEKRIYYSEKSKERILDFTKQNIYKKWFDVLDTL